MIFWQILLLVVITSPKSIFARLEFNNAKCVVRDPNFMGFEYCFLRSVNRTYKYFSLRTRLYSLPIDNASVTLKVLKRDSRNIFNKFNVNIDGCKFLRNRGNQMANDIFNIFEKYSNLNHTCPYNHDVVLEKLPVDHVDHSVKLFFLPDGQYVFNTTWIMNNIPRAEVNLFLTKY